MCQHNPTDTLFMRPNNYATFKYYYGNETEVI